MNFEKKFNLHGQEFEKELVKECKELIEKSSILTEKLEKKIRMLEKNKLH